MTTMDYRKRQNELATYADTVIDAAFLSVLLVLVMLVVEALS